MHGKPPSSTSHRRIEGDVGLLLVASDVAVTSGVVIRVVSSGVVAAVVVTAVDVGQSFSSEDTPSTASLQSLSPSQTLLIDMQRILLRHVKLPVGQTKRSGEHTFSSSLFSQLSMPSHIASGST